MYFHAGGGAVIRPTGDAAALLGALDGSLERIDGLDQADYVTTPGGRLCVLVTSGLDAPHEEGQIAAALFRFMVDHSDRASLLAICIAMLAQANTFYRATGG